ncbi:hypothetical protein GGS26DRAFT_202626 [Hypomontagnella submonticulosa]|nr:hypothetical protein GGS26DRAFT_202626 [Hypomontagnella submonticulosa]
MKMSTILRYATTVLGVTGAISRKSRERGRFELHASHNATDDDKAPAQNKTTILSENSTETSHKEFIQMFDFIEANVYNNSRSDAEKGWVIPVSHAACTNWDLSTSEIRITVQMTIDWSNGGGKVVPRNFHKEIHGVAALYLCNCKWDWFDRAPRSEMAEFYERLVDMCGNGQSGWIFSKKWEKGYAVATKNYVLLPPTRENLCPPRCLGRY